MPALGELFDTVRRLIDAFEASDVPYALGGALAYGTWAEPRATTDVDFVVFVTEERIGEVLALLRTAGIVVDGDAARAEAATRGMFQGRSAEGYRVDVFLDSIPFYAEALARRVRVRTADRETWVHSAEVLAVFKLLFFRPKDLVDVARMLAVQGPRFDRAFVRDALVDIVGADDDRIAKWDALAAAG